MQTCSLGDKTFADIAAKNDRILPAITRFSDFSDNELVQTFEIIESTACKEGNNLDYLSNYEDISDVKDQM